ncbi:MAG: SEC-C metal-binding domain-containing protein [Bryobacteraceae bacterium]
MKPFTTPQITVIEALAAGATVTAAAELASVSRPTVYHWLENAPFAQALAFAKQEHAISLRDRLQSMTEKALDKLEAVLDNPKSSPSVLLRASLAILNRKNWHIPTIEDCAAEINDATDRVENDPDVQNNLAAYEKQLTKLYTKSNVSESTPQQTPRNAQCPCGSGKKFKRCCGHNAPPVLNTQAA